MQPSLRQESVPTPALSAVLAQVAQAATDSRRIARAFSQHPGLVGEVLKGLGAGETRLRFGCVKMLRLLSAMRPDLLYPHFSKFVRMLDHENQIFRWAAAFILSHLARRDTEDKFAAIFDKYFAPIPGPEMITAATVIQGAARIAMAKPHLADAIAAEVLKVGRARYRTRECRNVAIGHAIIALGEFASLLRNAGPALRFVSRQTGNARPATRNKANAFLKRHDRSHARS
jgi:hypothetical protein